MILNQSGVLIYRNRSICAPGLIIGVLISILFHPTQLNAVTLSTQVQNVSFNPTLYYDYNSSGFLKFDTRLGTLRAVTLKLNYLSLGGSFTFNQGSVGSSTITAFKVDILFYAASSLNNTAHNGLISDFDVGNLPQTGSVSVTNQTLPKTIARRGSATFNFDSSNNILTAPVVVLNLSSTNDLSFYKGIGISFAPAFTSITQFLALGNYGGNPTRDYSKLTETVGLSLYYDYIPAVIPESSKYGFVVGFFSLGLVIALRLRKESLGADRRV